MVTTFDFKAVSAVFAGIILGGYADGTGIQVTQNEDSFKLTVGADGEAVRAKSNNRSGRVKISLLQGSAANDLLSALHALDVNTSNGDGIGPLIIKDNSGRTLVTAEKAWLVKMPDGDLGRDVANRDWMIESDALVIFHGGN